MLVPAAYEKKVVQSHVCSLCILVPRLIRCRSCTSAEKPGNCPSQARIFSAEVKYRRYLHGLGLEIFAVLGFRHILSPILCVSTNAEAFFPVKNHTAKGTLNCLEEASTYDCAAIFFVIFRCAKIISEASEPFPLPFVQCLIKQARDDSGETIRERCDP